MVDKPYFNLALVGAGRIGRVHAAAALSCNASLRLVAIADSNPQRAREASALFASRTCDISDLVESRSLDFVILATPPDSHEQLAATFLEAGVSVLCEKPMGSNVLAAKKLAQAAASHRPAIAISSKFLFVEGVLEATRLINLGIVGRPLRLFVNFKFGVDVSSTWYVNSAISGGGVLADRGPQALDIVTKLLGRPIAVRATALAGSRYSVEDAVELEVETANGGRATCELSWRAGSVSDIYARLITEFSEIELGWEACRIRRGNNSWEYLCNGYSQKQAFSDQLLAFARTSRGDARFPASIGQSLDVALAIEAAYKTGLSGRQVQLPCLVENRAHTIAYTVNG